MRGDHLIVTAPVAQCVQQLQSLFGGNGGKVVEQQQTAIAIRGRSIKAGLVGSESQSVQGPEQNREQGAHSRSLDEHGLGNSVAYRLIGAQETGPVIYIRDGRGID